MGAADTPVTRVYVDNNGIVCYERFGAGPIKLGMTPADSRRAAMERCDVILRYCRRDVRLPYNLRTEEHHRVCDHPRSITYADLEKQTKAACDESLRVERKLRS